MYCHYFPLSLQPVKQNVNQLPPQQPMQSHGTLYSSYFPLSLQKKTANANVSHLTLYSYLPLSLQPVNQNVNQPPPQQPMQSQIQQTMVNSPAQPQM